MADGADRLAKLARLKSLKSGLKAKETVSAEDDGTVSLDAVLGSATAEETSSAPPVEAPAARESAPEASAPEPKKPEADSESLSAYFEALGIVPDSAKFANLSGAAPKPSEAPAPPVPEPKADTGREVDARDRWVDPVREDDTFLASFAGDGPAGDEGDEADTSLDSILDSFDDETETTVPDGVEAPASEPVSKTDLPEESGGFGKPVDIEAFEKEIGLHSAGPSGDDVAADDPSADAEGDTPLTITFDESRATLLEHVSKQMNCTIDDVVVTAIDWYLDALFGEDEPAMDAGSAE